VIPVLCVGVFRYLLIDTFAAPLWAATAALALAIAAQVTWLAGSRACDPLSSTRAPAPSATAAPSAKGWLVPFALVFAVFVARAWWRHELLPAYLLGESAITLTRAQDFANASPRDTLGFVHLYNLGLGPLFSLLPESARDVESTKRFTIVVYGVLVAGFLSLLYYATTRLLGLRVSMLLVLLTPAVSALLVASARRYKWHVGAFVAGIGVYMVLIALRDDVHRRALRSLGLALIAASVLVYHGSLILIGVLLGALLVEAFASEPGRREHPRRLAWAVAAALGVLALFIATHKDFSHFYFRVAWETTADPRPEFFLRARLMRNWHNLFDTFFVSGFSLPVSVLFFAGLCSCLATWRTSWLSRAHLCLLAGTYGPLFATFGLENPDDNHYALAPLLGILVAGLTQLALTLRLDAGRDRGFSMLALASILVWTETAHYEGARLYQRMDYAPSAGDYGYRLFLALEDARRVTDGAPAETRALFFAPAGAPETEDGPKRALIVSRGGFRELEDRLRWYGSPDDLAQALQQALFVERHATQVRAYIDDDVDVTDVLRKVGTLERYAYTVRRSQPHMEVWRESIPLRFIDFVSLR
jgi:hypothetical protein